MKYQRVKITGDNGNVLHISRGEDGSYYFRTTGDVILKEDSHMISIEVSEMLYDVVNSLEMDIPIGSTLTYHGQEFTCWRAPHDEDCSGCVFENARNCPTVACHDDDRADRQNIIFIRKR